MPSNMMTNWLKKNLIQSQGFIEIFYGTSKAKDSLKKNCIIDYPDLVFSVFIQSFRSVSPIKPRLN